MLKSFIHISFFFSVFLCSCKNNRSEEKFIVNTAVTNQNNDDAGQKVYNRYCLACHQTDGAGVPSTFPSLINTEWVQKDNVRLIKIILQGLSGPIEVHGETFSIPMPAHDYLTDQQIADVLTYIRANFNNNSPPISVDEVEKVRKSLKK